jgi:hypothetical protein
MNRPSASLLTQTSEICRIREIFLSLGRENFFLWSSRCRSKTPASLEAGANHSAKAPFSSTAAIVGIVIALILGLVVRITLLLLSGLLTALLLPRFLAWALLLLAWIILVLVGHRDDLSGEDR